MQQWIMNPRIHSPYWGIHCHLLCPQVFQWTSGWEMNFPLRDPQVPPGFILLMRMEFGTAQWEER
jgi:hypothetical protein